MKNRERKRVTAEDIQAGLKNKGRASVLNLPEGVESWYPKKAGSVSLNILPYVVSSKNHPDKVEKGTVWHSRRYTMHINVGSSGKSFLCPVSVGKPCPIHEYRAKLEKRGPAKGQSEKDFEELLRNLRGKNLRMFNIKHPDDPKKLAVFDYSEFNFFGGVRAGKMVGLQAEMVDDTDKAGFFNVVNGMGRTVKTRFSEAKMGKNTYLEADRFDFLERKDMDEDKILKKVVDLDTILIETPYEVIKQAFESGGAEDEDDKPKGKKKGKKSEDEDEDSDDDEDGDEKPKKGKKAKGKKKDEDEDESDDESEDDEDEDEEDDSEDDDDSDDDEDDDEGDDDEEDDDDDDSDDDED